MAVERLKILISECIRNKTTNLHKNGKGKGKLLGQPACNDMIKNQKSGKYHS